MAASASIVKAASRRRHGLAFVLTTGTGPALMAISVGGWLLLLASDFVFGAHGHAARAGLKVPSVAVWLVMLAAMMPLVLTNQTAHVWTRSLKRCRWRRILFFTFGYMFVWTTIGWLVVATAMQLINLSEPTIHPAIAAVSIALLWQATPLKQACLNRCHAFPPLAAFGLTADWHAVRYGITAGSWCVGSCWALMLVPAAMDGAHVTIMAVTMGVAIVERHAPYRRAAWRVPMVG